jgi:hypothetical protein
MKLVILAIVKTQWTFFLMVKEYRKPKSSNWLPGVFNELVEKTSEGVGACFFES